MSMENNRYASRSISRVALCSKALSSCDFVSIHQLTPVKNPDNGQCGSAHDSANNIGMGRKLECNVAGLSPVNPL